MRGFHQPLPAALPVVLAALPAALPVVLAALPAAHASLSLAPNPSPISVMRGFHQPLPAALPAALPPGRAA